MLVIDDNMFKLAKMQETLLRVSTSNREENLNNYKKTVAEIDTKAFEEILKEIKNIDEHNHSLEDELQFLEGIKSAYDQLLELQLSFKRICEIYGNTDLKLSDLFRLNIEYIENRINAISGYLMNLKNIEVNKKKLQELNEMLIEEEKKKISLDNRLLELDKILRSEFGTVEGRCIVDGNLQYTNVVSEYEKTGYDFNRLLDDDSHLNSVLVDAVREKREKSDKVKAAEICYNSVLTADSRQILNEINIEYLKIKYRVAMLKIVQLLSENSNGYKSFVEKRETMLELIKCRLSCMESLGMQVPKTLDPFSRTKVKEQLDTVKSLTDNSDIINTTRKEISHLNSWTEEMVSQNNNYLITLNDTRNLIESNIGLGDIDITSVVSFDELLVKHEVAENQVVSTKGIPTRFNMNIVSQKTTSVIKRVNQMMNGKVVKKKEIKEEFVPELVIVPTTNNEEKTEEIVNLIVPNDNFSEIIPEPIDEVTVNDIYEDELEDTVDSFDVKDEENLEPIFELINTNIFETVTPFAEPALFTDKTDDSMTNSQTNEIEFLEHIDLNVNEEVNDQVEEVISDSVDEMPEVFWTTQEEVTIPVAEETDEDVLSFDEQINALLAVENNDAGRSKKRVA